MAIQQYYFDCDYSRFAPHDERKRFALQIEQDTRCS